MYWYYITLDKAIQPNRWSILLKCCYALECGRYSAWDNVCKSFLQSAAMRQGHDACHCCLFTESSEAPVRLESPCKHKTPAELRQTPPTSNLTRANHKTRNRKIREYVKLTKRMGWKKCILYNIIRKCLFNPAFRDCYKKNKRTLAAVMKYSTETACSFRKLDYRVHLRKRARFWQN